MRLLRLLPPSLLLAGITLVIASSVQGSARLFLFLIFPVFAGNSLPFLMGVVLLVIGVFSMPLTLGWQSVSKENSSSPPGEDGPPDPKNSKASWGGIILLGPIPLFVGAWKGHPPISYWVAAALGALLLVLVAGLLVFG